MMEGKAFFLVLRFLRYDWGEIESSEEREKLLLLFITVIVITSALRFIESSVS